MFTFLLSLSFIVFPFFISIQIKTIGQCQNLHSYTGQAEKNLLAVEHQVCLISDIKTLIETESIS